VLSPSSSGMGWLDDCQSRSSAPGLKVASIRRALTPVSQLQARAVSTSSRMAMSAGVTPRWALSDPSIPGGAAVLISALESFPSAPSSLHGGARKTTRRISSTRLSDLGIYRTV